MNDEIKAILERMTPEERAELAKEGSRLAWRRWYSDPVNRERRRQYNQRYYAERALRRRLQEEKKA